MMNFYPPGTLIINRYEVASRPLQGGMGIVYLCMDRQTDLPVALKTFQPQYLPDREARDRFLQEGTTWVSLGKHPHIVQCHGVEHIGDGREIYLVLELVAKAEGRTDASLRAWLTPGTSLPIEQALLFALQIVRGMQHSCAIMPGFVHRDLKPENLLVGADMLPGWNINRLRITDFGLVGLLESRTEHILEEPINSSSPLDLLHPTISIRGGVGTPLYMAPEQWQGRVIYPQTDIFAFGCILGEMLCGEHVIPGDTQAELEHNSVTGKIRPLPTSLPKGIIIFLNTCLARHPLERFNRWEEVLAELESLYASLCGQPAPRPVEVVALDRAERVRNGWAFNDMGISYLDLGKAETALHYFQHVREIGQTEKEQPLEEAGLSHLGLASASLGKPFQAISYYEQALSIARAIKNRFGEGVDLGNLGTVYFRLGDAQRAIRYLEQALTIDQEIGNQRGEVINLNGLGNAYIVLGDIRQAIKYYEQALTISREIGDRRREGGALGSLGIAYRNLGNARRAIEYYEQAVAIFHEVGDRRGEDTFLGNLGNAYLQLGDPHQAIRYYEQALTIDREIGDRQGEGSDLCNLGIAVAELGETQQAISFYKQALKITREIGDRRGEGNILGSLGNAFKRLGDAQQALEYYEQAFSIHREIGDVLSAASGLFNMAQLYQQQGDPSHALPLAQLAVQIFTQIGHPGYIQRAKQLVAQLQGGDAVQNNHANAE